MLPVALYIRTKSTRLQGSCFHTTSCYCSNLYIPNSVLCTTLYYRTHLFHIWYASHGTKS